MKYLRLSTILLLAAALVAGALGYVSPALAQNTSAIVVAACGTPPTTYSAGQNRQVTQDTNGRVCQAASATISGTVSENLAQVNGQTVNVGPGAAGTGTQRVTTSTDSTIATVGAVTAITNALPAGSNVIGQVTANAGTNLNTSALALDSTVSAMSAKLPASLGPKTGAASLSVVPASDGFSVSAGGYSFQLAPTVTVQNASYAAGNSEGGLITMTGAARTNGGSGTLTNLRLKSTGGSLNTVWVYAWSKTPVATCTDKSAYVNSTTDAPYLLPGFPVQAVLGTAPGVWDAYTYAQILGLNSQFKNQDSSPGTSLFFCIVTAGAVTPPTTADLSFVGDGYQD